MASSLVGTVQPAESAAMAASLSAGRSNSARVTASASARGGPLCLGEGPVGVEPGRALATKAGRRLIVQHPKRSLATLPSRSMRSSWHTGTMAAATSPAASRSMSRSSGKPVNCTVEKKRSSRTPVRPPRSDRRGSRRRRSPRRRRPLALEVTPVSVGAGRAPPGRRRWRGCPPGRALEGGEPGQRILARQTHRLARVGDDEIEVLAGDGLGQFIEPQRMQHEAMAGHALCQPAQQRLPLGSGQCRAAGCQHADAYRLGQGLHRRGLGWCGFLSGRRWHRGAGRPAPAAAGLTGRARAAG
jgi:hypothetical protein